MQALWRAASEAAENSARSDGSPANPAEEAVYQELEEQVLNSIHPIVNACWYPCVFRAAWHQLVL